MNPYEREPTSEGVIPLHIHTFYTFLNSPSSPSEYVLQAKKLGYPAIGIADTGNFYGLAEFITACNRHNVKPIPGVELPLSLGLADMTNATFLAQDNEGLLDLFSWVSRVKRDGKMLEIGDIENRKGRVAVLVRGPSRLIQEVLDLDNFFYAIDTPTTTRPGMAELINRVIPDKSAVAHDVRMARLEEGKILQTLRSLAKGKYLSHPIEKADFLNHRLMSPQALTALYKEVPHGLARTREIAQDAHITLPEPPTIRANIVPEGIRSTRYLEYLVETKLAQRADRESLLPRIDRELLVIKTLGFSDYTLICFEIAQFCKDRNIKYSVTGSGNNSAVLNVLGITHVDAKDLLFERFLNFARADLPDVDFDVPYDRKEEVIRFILDGYENATRLAVVRHLRGRGIIQLSNRADVPLTSRQVRELESAKLPIGIGTHPSGVIFANNPPQERMGEYVMAQLDKGDAEGILNLHKIDVLTSSGLTKIAWTKEYLAEDGIEIDEIPEDDERTLARVFSGDTIGIANVESPHLRGLLKTTGSLLEYPKLEHIVQVLALARPATSSRSSYFEWIAGKAQQHDERINYIVGKTGGTIIFQEQILRLTTEVAGLPWSQADKLRKLTTEGIAAEEVNTLRQDFIQGCVKYGLSVEEATKLFSQIEQFKNYGFIEGHARSLAKTTYECVWLSEHFPVHWWTSVVNTAADGQGLYPLQAYVNEALRHGVTFYFPPVDKIQDYAKPYQGLIAIGKKLVRDQENFGMKYSRFLQSLYDGVAERNPVRSIRSQLESFDVSFTRNPMYLIPSRYHFDPEKETSEIVGQPMFVSVREELGLLFITIDSGRIIDVTVKMDTPLYQRKKGNLDPSSRFWRFGVRTEGNRVEVTDILAPPKIFG